jgi:hypothetical protein
MARREAKEHDLATIQVRETSEAFSMKWHGMKKRTRTRSCIRDALLAYLATQGLLSRTSAELLCRNSLVDISAAKQSISGNEFRPTPDYMHNHKTSRRAAKTIYGRCTPHNEICSSGGRVELACGKVVEPSEQDYVNCWRMDGTRSNNAHQLTYFGAWWSRFNYSRNKSKRRTVLGFWV